MIVLDGREASEDSICTSLWLRARARAGAPLATELMQPCRRRHLVVTVDGLDGVQEFHAGTEPVVSRDRTQHLGDEVPRRLQRQPLTPLGPVLQIPGAESRECLSVGYL